jgi:hypothetical protein
LTAREMPSAAVTLPNRLVTFLSSRTGWDMGGTAPRCLA